MSDIYEELRAEAEAKAGKPYDPLAHKLDWSRIDAQAANDDAVAAENERAAARLSYFDDDDLALDSAWDRLREGRSAT